MPNGPLPLPARLYLLAWDTARREVLEPARLPLLVRAGALAELARRGLLTDDEGIATPLDLDSRTGDAVLDGLLELVSESLPHDWHTWVRLRARHTLDAVREQLVAEGVLRAERRRVLWVFPSVEHVLADTVRVDALHREARLILDGPAPPETFPRPAATAVALAAAAGLLPGADGRRVEQLLRRAGSPAPALDGITSALRTTPAESAPVPSARRTGVPPGGTRAPKSA
ncbi:MULTISPECIES: GPP34 family phosphoprotein [unclassified Streptomyces]|uniref:GOLPH3/VPS74 family protein n=1 Tax=unclassified Streptomyces TaxID=2593676 RepID=UPI0036F84333